MNFGNIARSLKGAMYPAVALGKKYGPTALVVGGVVGLVSAGVIACIKTPEAVEVIEEANDDIEKARDDMKKGQGNAGNLVKAYACGCGRVVRHYAIPLSVAGLSIIAIFGSHRILVGRNLALGAAYKALNSSFKTYRGRVVDEFGEDVDRDILYGAKWDGYEIEDVDGKRRLVPKQTGEFLDRAPHDLYLVKFDEVNSERWTNNHTDNLFTLECAERYWTDYLRIYGHVTENEVRKYLGMKPVKGGGSRGWHLEKTVLPDGTSAYITDGDPYVSFNLTSCPSGRRFLNDPNEPSVWFYMNCQGYIDDLPEE